MSSKFFDKATREWVQIRKKLYLQIKADVHKLLGDSWRELIPLEKKYAKEMKQAWRSVQQQDLYEEFKRVSLVLLGDFHALQQSQRGHLRILRAWPESDPIVLAVEFFQARHQKLLDAYARGELKEEVFLEKIGWNKSWGFPWEHYKPIVDWAIQHRVPIFGINWGLRQTKLHSIKTRENFSSVCLRKIHRRFPQRRIVVIYGDLHLAKGQLPAAIRKQACFRKSKIRKVFQNDETIYFDSLENGLESKLEYLQLRDGDFCVQAVPPWVKWQSYLLFLENTYDRQIDDWEGDIDHTDHVAKLVDFLNSEFNLKLPRMGLAVYTADDTRVYVKMRKVLHKKEWEVVQGWISEQRSFYIPELEMGYLGRVTVNHTAALAGEYVHSQLCRRKKLYFQGDKDLERQIWIQAMAYLGSKTINHKRKTNSIEDLRRSLLASGANGQTRRVLLLALNQKVREVGYFTHGQLLPLKKDQNSSGAYMEAARLLGAMLGEKLYLLYRSKQWKSSEIVKLMAMPMEGSEFIRKYYLIAKRVHQSQTIG